MSEGWFYRFRLPDVLFGSALGALFILLVLAFGSWLGKCGVLR